MEKVFLLMIDKDLHGVAGELTPSLSQSYLAIIYMTNPSQNYVAINYSLRVKRCNFLYKK